MNNSGNKSLISTSFAEYFVGDEDISFMIGVLAMTLILNFLSGIIIWRLPGFEQNKYHLVVRTLILANFLLPIPTFPLSVASYMYRVWIGGQISCVISAFLSNLFLGWSTFLVVIMCILRYLALMKPLFYRKHVTYPRLKAAIAGSFIWGTLHMILPIGGVGKFRVYSRGMYCGLDLTPERQRDQTLVYLVVGEGVITIIILLYFCTVILAALKKKRRISDQISTQQQRALSVSKTNRQHGGFAGIFLAIVILYCLCYAPYLAYRIMVVARGMSYYDSDSHFYTQIIAYMNPLLSPVIYIMCNKRYRESLKDFLVSGFPFRYCCGDRRGRLRSISGE